MKRTSDALSESIEKLTKDVKQSAGSLSRTEARHLVDLYYAMQRDRIRHDSQTRAASHTGEPHEVFIHFGKQFDLLEKQMRRSLDAFSQAHTVGRWSRLVVGIGPVISAGLIAHIDITRAPTVGHIWNYAGLNPTAVWEKGQKRPWNAELKTLCWKLGESFVKTSSREGSFYGPLYIKRKEIEQKRNATGDFANQAKVVGKDTDAYKYYSKGFLPPAHIHARARRWVVKLFLSHWHTVAYYDQFGQMPPAPYSLDILGHAHVINPPNWERK